MVYRRPKLKCEICNETNKKVLDRHHIIPKYSPLSTELDSNLAILCANCHRRVHGLEIICEGVFPTSEGNKFFWHMAGEPYIIRPGIILNIDGTVTILEE